LRLDQIEPPRSDCLSLRVDHRPDGRPALDKTATGSLSGESRDPFIRLLSAQRVGPGFSPVKRLYHIAPLDHLVSC
jgi:hypothetical protein